jgi:cytochrome c peroxidase
MHDGRFETLREVLEFYSTLPDTPAIGHREESLQALNLTEEELSDLEAFLTSLTGAPLNERLLKAPENP